ncbi:DUF3160 domain-containing protein, partial [bacterium]|nr:DUF3160 domain-containing protein [bacterium]
TTDGLLHVYHRLFELELEYLEDTKFLPLMQDMLTGTWQQLQTELAASTNDDKSQSLLRLQQYLSLPLAIVRSLDYSTENEYSTTPRAYFQALDASVVEQNLANLTASLPADMAAAAQDELTKVLAADQVTNSAFTGQLHDYTQYTPRSHYNKNALGQAYFKAMMYLARMNFATSNPDEQLNIRQTYDALNLVAALSASQQLATWRRITQPLNYLVGNSDDLSVEDYLNFASTVQTPADAAALLPQIRALQKPQIMSAALIIDPAASKSAVQDSAQAFALFSQRFTPDAYIFSNLTQGDEAADPGTGEKLPSMTTALAVPTALDSNQTAATKLSAWVKTNYPQSQNVFAKNLHLLENEFASWGDTDWSANHYIGWLQLLNTLDDGKPLATVDPSAWADKELNTYLGSYTELKHDTLLYAKQNYAEMGGGGDDCEVLPVPYGYVENNPTFFRRLADLTNANLNWLARSGLEVKDDNQPSWYNGDAPITWRLESFARDLDFYQQIITAQNDNVSLGEEDYERLRHSFGQLAYLLTPVFNVEQTERMARSALVADIHTDLIGQQILYEANAVPDEIFVAIDDVNGRRLVRGLVYSYREFTDSLTNRLTDERWWQDVYTADGQRDTLPARAAWWTPYFGQ